MKRIVLTLSAILFFFSGYAQITVNRSDYAVAGDWYYLANDTLVNSSGSAMLKTTGANKTWDISGWAHRHTKDTLFFADGLTHPNAPAGCNLVAFTRNPDTPSIETSAEYYVITNSALKILIEAGTFGGTEGALKVFNFPSTMGATFKDSVESYTTMLASDFGLTIPFVDSLRLYFKMRMNSIIDGYGKLKMDAGTFDVLKQTMNQEFLLTAKIRNTITGTYSNVPSGMGFGNFNQSMKMYNWVSSNGGYPLLSVQEDTSGNVAEMKYVLASSRGLRSGLKELRSASHYSKVYPVPATDQITIETISNKATMATLAVYDILGNQVMANREVEITSGSNQLPVNVNQLKPGVYFYTLSGNGFNTSSRFVVK